MDARLDDRLSPRQGYSFLKRAIVFFSLAFPTTNRRRDRKGLVLGLGLISKFHIISTVLVATARLASSGIAQCRSWRKLHFLNIFLL